MIKFAVEQWSKNKTDLERHFSEYLHLYESCDYTEIVKAVVEHVYNAYDEDNKESEHLRWQFDTSKISAIDNGDYQGTVLYMIPRDIYKPSEGEYLLTNVGYRSCSGCDTLLGVQYTIGRVVDRYGYEELTEDEKAEQKRSAIGDLMTLSLHLVQNTIKPYNSGWNRNEEFDEVSHNSDDDFDEGGEASGSSRLLF